MVNCWCTEKLPGLLGSSRCCLARDGSTCRMPLQRRLRRDGSFHSLLRSFRSLSAVYAGAVSAHVLFDHVLDVCSCSIPGRRHKNIQNLPPKSFLNWKSLFNVAADLLIFGFYHFAMVWRNISKLKWESVMLLTVFWCHDKPSAQTWTIRVETWTSILLKDLQP